MSCTKMKMDYEKEIFFHTETVDSLRTEYFRSEKKSLYRNKVSFVSGVLIYEEQAVLHSTLILQIFLRFLYQ